VSSNVPAPDTLIWLLTGRPLFAREFDILGRNRGLQLRWLPGPRRSPDSWLGAGARPHHDLTLLRRWVPDIADRDVYVCGPPQWTAAGRRTLAAAELPAAQLHVENFGWLTDETDRDLDARHGHRSDPAVRLPHLHLRARDRERDGRRGTGGTPSVWHLRHNDLELGNELGNHELRHVEHQHRHHPDRHRLSGFSDDDRPWWWPWI
jgi:hypothetical protein